MTKAVFTSYESFKEKFGDSLPFIAWANTESCEVHETKVLYIEGVSAVFLRDYKVAGRMRYVAEGYGWKAKKNSHFHYYYSTAEARAEKALDYLSRLAKHKAEVSERRKGHNHDVKVGDIFVASWGYDQTNVDYFKVTRTTKCTVDLVSIGKKFIESESRHGSDRVAPDPNRELSGDETVYKRKRVRMHGEAAYITIDSVRSASRCKADATHHQTPWGMGH